MMDDFQPMSEASASQAAIVALHCKQPNLTDKEENEAKPRGAGSKGFLDRTPLSQIMATDYPPIRWAIHGYVPEGFSVLAGRQKLGKTWLALDWSIAVAIGGTAMGGIVCEAGDVLYLDLENGERRIKRRIETIFPDERIRPNLSGIQIVSKAPELDKGLIDGLEEWRLGVQNPRLIVIDVLQRVKPPGGKNRNAYESDYSIFAELQHWATDNCIAVVGLHHTRKGGADDPLEALSGSNGLSAVADTTLVLDSDQNGLTLYLRGRDVEEREVALRHRTGFWEILGEASEVHRSEERGAILSVLLIADAPMNPAEIATATGMSRNNVDQLLYKMAKAEEVQKSQRGRYVHADRDDLLP